MHSVERFHTALATQSSWLTATEKSLRAFKVPSKLMDGIQAQICSLKVGISSVFTCLSHNFLECIRLKFTNFLISFFLFLTGFASM